MRELLRHAALAVPDPGFEFRERVGVVVAEGAVVGRVVVDLGGLVDVGVEVGGIVAEGVAFVVAQGRVGVGLGVVLLDARGGVVGAAGGWGREGAPVGTFGAEGFFVGL